MVSLSPSIFSALHSKYSGPPELLLGTQLSKSIKSNPPDQYHPPIDAIAQNGVNNDSVSEAVLTPKKFQSDSFPIDKPKWHRFELPIDKKTIELEFLWSALNDNKPIPRGKRKRKKQKTNQMAVALLETWDPKPFRKYIKTICINIAKKLIESGYVSVHRVEELVKNKDLLTKLINRIKRKINRIKEQRGAISSFIMNMVHFRAFERICNLPISGSYKIGPVPDYRKIERSAIEPFILHVSPSQKKRWEFNFEIRNQHPQNPQNPQIDIGNHYFDIGGYKYFRHVYFINNLKIMRLYHPGIECDRSQYVEFIFSSSEDLTLISHPHQVRSFFRFNNRLSDQENNEIMNHFDCDRDERALGRYKRKGDTYLFHTSGFWSEWHIWADQYQLQTREMHLLWAQAYNLLGEELVQDLLDDMTDEDSSDPEWVKELVLELMEDHLMG